MHGYQHVLAPVDFSDTGSIVIKRAKEIAERYDTRLSLLHVVQDVAPLGAEPFGEPSALIINEELREQQLKQAEEKLEELANQHDLPLSVDRAIAEGFTTDAILEFASEKQVDLIVIAHSGKKGFFGLLGSTADSVVKSAKCDILVIRNLADE